jgi:hypothetical protein
MEKCFMLFNYGQHSTGSFSTGKNSPAASVNSSNKSAA